MRFQLLGNSGLRVSEMCLGTMIARHWAMILGYTLAFMAAKALVVFTVAKLFGADRRQAFERGLLMALGGEFALVLFSAATTKRIIDAEQNAMLTAVVILSMVIAPFLLMALRLLSAPAERSADGLEVPASLSNSVLVVGFGRFGQVASQLLFARGYSISIIDTDVEMVETARELGFNVYYGDGTRLDVLKAAGLGDARIVLVCTDQADATTRIVELVKSQSLPTPVLARTIDRVHGLTLTERGVDVQIRETFESAIALGSAALDRLGSPARETSQLVEDFRRRDEERFALERAGGLQAGRALFHPDAAMREGRRRSNSAEAEPPSEP